MPNREQVLKPLRGRDYRGPETRSYPEPSEAEQAEALRQAQAKGQNRRRAKHDRR